MQISESNDFWHHNYLQIQPPSWATFTDEWKQKEKKNNKSLITMCILNRFTKLCGTQNSIKLRKRFTENATELQNLCLRSWLHHGWWKKDTLFKTNKNIYRKKKTNKRQKLFSTCSPFFFFFCCCRCTAAVVIALSRSFHVFSEFWVNIAPFFCVCSL